MKKSIFISAVAAATLALAGCATDPYYSSSGVASGPYYSNGYSTSGAYNNGYRYHDGYNRYDRRGVESGVVEGVRYVNVSSTSGAGIGIGAVAGGVLGNQIGKGSGRTAATVIGAIGGGVLGNEIEKNNNRNQRAAVELRVRLDRTGQVITFVQPDDGVRFNYGTRVRLYPQGDGWVARY